MKIKYFLLLPIVLLFLACNSQKVSYSEAVPQPITYQQTARATPMMASPVGAKRKITMSANIEVEVDNINKATKELTLLLKSYSGHIENTRLSEDGYYYANIKVPSEKLISTLDAIAKLGEKTSQSINKRDITERFTNHEERLKNLKIFKDKMKLLLNRTSNIEEILRIERELNRIQTEIDMLERNLKDMQSSVEMSPISVNLKEKTIYGPLGYVGNGIWWAIKKLFVIR